jgi:hypothetical protein
MLAGINRVQQQGARELGWPPRHDDVRTLIGRLNADDDFRSPLARAIGRNRHHDRGCEDGPQPVARNRT